MKIHRPKISIIIPVYNTEKYLSRCLDSLLNQTFQDWCAICIDDGSTDNSAKILDKYTKNDNRFIVIHKKNAGVSSARNDGVTKANSEYVMFLDSDDCIHPQTLEIAYNTAVKNNVDIVSFKYDANLYKDALNSANVDDLLKTRIVIRYDLQKIRYKQTDSLIKFATERNHSFGRYKIRHCYPVVHLYKLDLIKGIKFNTKIKVTEDFPFWTSVLLRNPKSIILNIPLYFYIPNKTSALGATNIEKFFDNVSLSIIESFKTVLKNEPQSMWVKIWKREFLWPFIITCVRSVRAIQDKQRVIERLIKMKEMNIFDNPPTFRARKYKHRIEKIISPIS